MNRLALKRRKNHIVCSVKMYTLPEHNPPVRENTCIHWNKQLACERRQAFLLAHRRWGTFRATSLSGDERWETSAVRRLTSSILARDKSRVLPAWQAFEREGEGSSAHGISLCTDAGYKSCVAYRPAFYTPYCSHSHKGLAPREIISREIWEDSNSLTFQQSDSRNLIISNVPKVGGRGL